jgi:iron complex outermembrane receptor protein
MLRGGVRTDSILSGKDTLMVQGDMYSAREGIPTVSFPSVTSASLENVEEIGNLSGGFIQGGWKHTFSPRSDMTLQSSYGRYERDDLLREGRDTLNLDFQNNFSGWARQNIVWGVTYEYSASKSYGNLTGAFFPSDLGIQTFGSFVQDEVAIVPNRLFLTIGTKVEHNHYTGWDLMPSARIAWVLGPHHTLWGAISKADRTPSELDASSRATLSGSSGPGGVPVLVTFIGNPNIENETTVGFESGYRTTILKHASIDIAAYYDTYAHQETVEPATAFVEDTPPPVHLVYPITFANLMHGETHGVEVAVNLEATHRWTLSPGYAFENVGMRLAPTSADTDNSVSKAEGSSPADSAQLRSHLVLGHGVTSDTSAYFVGRLSDPREPSYTRVDTNLSWHFRERASLSFVGQNLVRDGHQEFVDSTDIARTTLVRRSAYVKLSWLF